MMLRMKEEESRLTEFIGLWIVSDLDKLIDGCQVQLSESDRWYVLFVNVRK